jgi:hypothetical protein
MELAYAHVYREKQNMTKTDECRIFSQHFPVTRFFSQASELAHNALR